MSEMRCSVSICELPAGHEGDHRRQLLGPSELMGRHHDAFCWVQPHDRMVACDRVWGHLGPHSWEISQRA